MDYRYTDEEQVAVALTLTFREIRQLIEILEPISKDNENRAQFRASDLHARFSDMRKQMLTSAIESLQFELDRSGE